MLRSSLKRLADVRGLACNVVDGMTRRPKSDAIVSRTWNVQVGVSEQVSTKNKWARHNKHNNSRAISTEHQSTKKNGEFMAVFPEILRTLTDVELERDISELSERYRKVLQYNVPNGKHFRGLALVDAYKALEDPIKLTPENLRLAYIMGWCVELLQAEFIIVDDIIDNTETRRGVPCWYKLPGVGLHGRNDAVFLEQSIYVLLRRHFSARPYYMLAIDLFHEVILKSSMGEALDIKMSNAHGKPDLNLFTMDRYKAITKYKAAYYTFHLPVGLAMYMAGKCDPELHRHIEAIMIEMGHFYQVQDDFLDCYGDSSSTGKTSCDIREGKCSWFIVVALQKATAIQREILETNYGRAEPEAVQAVRNVYEEQELRNTYSNYEQESYNLIRAHIQQIPKDIPHSFFYKMMERIYKRSS